ncbi:hypothetical protein [uncultured Amnibacterium sp.]|uniref:hypothetical protein n=1 Tax=uncultured Amnibacterium sp. TaxID=1631851 RepID=UPI0035CC09EC
MDLTGVARLARVQRPVASVWRTRFAASLDPFPPVLSEKNGRALFDAMAVAAWLARTGHGNNRDAVADTAAAAAPARFDFADASHVAAVDALLALRAVSGSAVGGASLSELVERATVADPDDSCLVTELSRAEPTWAEWTDSLADAAYSPLEASRLLERRHLATTSSAGSSGPLTSDADALLTALVHALGVDRLADVLVGPGISASFGSELVPQLGDDVELVVSPLPQGRAIRRRLLCDGIVLPATQPTREAPRLHIERLPLRGARSAAEMLQVVDDLVLDMRDQDRAIVIAPASVMVGPLRLADGLTRTDVLRSGRVRAIAKLPSGLVTAAPREALALWVLGRETGDVPIADRFTAVIDLTNASLTLASRSDLVSDVLASMGGARDVRAHAFRFARLIPTRALLASRGALVRGGRARALDVRAARDLPALLDQARVELGEDAPPLMPSAEPGPTIPSALVEELIAQRHLRVLSGTHVKSDEFSASGLVVICAEDLDAPARIGDRRIDQLTFAAQHPSVRLTVAGDVVFRTGPTAKAWVDLDGSKIVAHPARVLRIDAADPGGLVPELVAADIGGSFGGPAAWRRWRLRRVAPASIVPLRAGLSDVAVRREALARRLKALDTYAELLSAGVVLGAVTLTDPAAYSASEN